MLFLILWTVFIAINVAIHWYIIVKKQGWPNHPLWVVIRGVVLIILALYTGGDWRANILGGFLYFQFPFQTGLNLTRGKKAYYLSDHGFDAFLMRVVASQTW